MPPQPPRTVSQEPLPDMPPLPEPTPVANQGFDLNRRRAFGAVPNLLQLVRTDDPNLEISAEILQSTSPAAMYPVLFNVSANYRDGNYVDGILLNNTEYSHIARNVPALSRQVGSRVLAANAISSHSIRSVRAADGVRQMLTGYIERQTKASLGFSQEIERLTEIKQLAQAPGFAMTTAGNLLRLTAGAWELSFRNILQTAGEQQGWSGDELVLAEAALSRVLSAGPQRNRVSGWQQYTQLARRYAAAKKRLFDGRTRDMTLLLEKTGSNLDAAIEVPAAT